jgi:hypothetical protein
MSIHVGESHQSRFGRFAGLAAPVALVALALLTAYGIADGAPADEGVFLTSDTPLGAAPARTARISGVLDVDSHGCVLVGDHVVVWPSGYYAAHWNPLEVRDDAGRVVARQGQQIEFGGGIAPAPESRCTRGGVEAAFVQSRVATI